LQDDIDESMATKLAIANVCQSWREFIVPAMFEVLIFHNHGYVETLNILINDITPDLPIPISLQRFDIQVFEQGAALDKSLNQGLVDVLKRRPDLKVYRHVGESPSSIEPELVKVLLASCACSLRQLELHGCILASNIRDLLATASGLEILSHGI
jgi:hypothetical protein